MSRGGILLNMKIELHETKSILLFMHALPKKQQVVSTMVMRLLALMVVPFPLSRF